MKFDHFLMTALVCGVLVATKNVHGSEPKVEYVSSLQTIEPRVVSVRQTSEGLIMFLQLTNRSDIEERALYRINWLDKSGHDVVSGEPWRLISIPAYEARSFEISAPTASAEDYRIQISTGKKFQYSSKLTPVGK